MKCPYCNYYDSKVIDSRAKNNGRLIRRRRECLECGKRFTTREEVEMSLLLVIKMDGRREPFDPEKLRRGIITACAKRPISSETIATVVSRVENQLRESGQDEVASQRIGELVMRELKSVDEVAYVRFASVYRKFSDKEEFITELNELN
jgi:transcriptional repressor NrdR